MIKLKNSFLCIFCLYPQFFCLIWCEHASIEKKNSISWSKLRLQMFIFHFFLVQRLVSRIWLYLSWKTLFCASFGCTQKFFYLLSPNTHLFKLIFRFWPTPRFKTLVFHFFRASDTFFLSDFDQIEELFFTHRLVVARKKIISHAARTYILKKNRFFFTWIKISNVSIYFFSNFRHLFSKYDLYHLEELLFAHLLIASRIFFTSHSVSPHFKKTSF